MANVVKVKNRIDGSEPAATSLAGGELGIKQVASSGSTAASGKLYYGEDVGDGSTPDGTTVARAFGIGVKGSSGSQRGVPIGGNLIIAAGTGISTTATVSGDVATLTVTNSTPGLSGLGSTDNVILRTDGTGGATAQGSSLVIDDSANLTGVNDITAANVTASTQFISDKLNSQNHGGTHSIEFTDSFNSDDAILFEVGNSVRFAMVENSEGGNRGIIPWNDNDVNLGHSSYEFKNLYLDGTAYIDTLEVHTALDMDDNIPIRLGSSQDANLEYDATLDGIVWSETTNDGNLDQFFYADGGEDNADRWRFRWANGGTFTMANYTSSSYVDKFTITSAGVATIAGALTASGITSTGAANTFGATSFNDADITNVGSIALDTITNDGTDITLDSSGDVIIDAGAGDIYFKDGGTTYGRFDMGANDIKFTVGGNNFEIENTGDFVIDASADIQLDAAGGNIEFLDGGTLQLSLDMDGTGGAQVIQLRVDSDDLIFKQYDGTEVLRLDDDGDVKVYDDLRLTSDSSVFAMGVGNDFTITHDGTTGATIAGNPITIDSDGDIILDANGADIIFKDAGTTIATFTNSSSDFIIDVESANNDFKITGTDGGSDITALFIDMSDAGATYFNGNNIYLEPDATNPKLTLTSSSTATTTQAEIIFNKTGTGSSNIELGKIQWWGDDASNNNSQMGSIGHALTDATHGGEDSMVSFETMNSGSMVEMRMQFTGTYDLIWPSDNGSADQHLATNGSGVLSWVDPPEGGGGGDGDITAVVAGTGLTGGATSGSATLNVGTSQTQVVAVGALDAGSITSGFGAIDVGSSTITSTGSLQIRTIDYSDGDLAMTIADGGGVTFDENTTLAGFILDGNTITGIDDSGEFTDNDAHIMTSAGVNDRIESFGYTTNSGDITAVVAGDGLDGGATSGSATLTVDVSDFAGDGLADDGSENLDLDIHNLGTTGTTVHGTADYFAYSDAGTTKKITPANINLSSFNNDSGWTTNSGDITAVTAGTGLSGGGTSGGVTLDVAAAQTGITSIYATDLMIGEDSETCISFQTANKIQFKVGNVSELTLDGFELYPTTDAGCSLGKVGNEFQDGYFDGELTCDDLTCSGTSTTLGTVTSGIWQGTAIASGYIAGDAITGAKIADDAIDSEHYTDGSIDTAHIAGDAITAALIADDAISEEHLDPTIISALTDTTIADADYVMFWDATDSQLKKVDAAELTSGGGGGSGANTDLGNLSSVAINTTLVSDTNATDDLGTSGIGWKDLYLTGSVFVDGVEGVTNNIDVLTSATLIPVMPGVYSLATTQVQLQFNGGVLTRTV